MTEALLLRTVEAVSSQRRGMASGCTVPIRRNLTGNSNGNGNGTDRERIENGDRTGMEQIQNGYRTDTEREWNRYRTGTGTRAEWKQNASCQAFPVRFLLDGTVVYVFNYASAVR